MSILREIGEDIAWAVFIIALLLACMSGCASLEPPPMTCVEAGYVVPMLRWQELDRRCWYIAVNKTGDKWVLHAKVDTGGIASKTYYVEGASFDEVVQKTMGEMEKRP